MFLHLSVLIFAGIAVLIYSVVVWYLRIDALDIAEIRQDTIDALKSHQTFLFEALAHAEKEALTAERRVAELEKQLVGIREIVAPAQTPVPQQPKVPHD